MTAEQSLESRIEQAIRHLYPDLANLATLMRVVAEAHAAAQLAEKEREMQKTIDLLDSQLGESMKETKAAEQRLQEAQARIKYLENVKVRAGRGERSTI